MSQWIAIIFLSDYPRVNLAKSSNQMNPRIPYLGGPNSFQPFASNPSPLTAMPIRSTGTPVELSGPLFSPRLAPPMLLPKPARRQVIKIHGVSRGPNGDLLFAVSFARARTFQYLTHAEMVENHPTYLIGFYERNL
jgi:hypothetical protein